LKRGQISEIWPKRGQSGNSTQVCPYAKFFSAKQTVKPFLFG